MYLSLWLADYPDPMSDMDALQSNNYQTMVDIIVPIMIDM